MHAPSSIGIVTPQVATFTEPLLLSSSGQLETYQLVYETYGQLNADASNAVLVCHALSSDHHAAGRHHESDKNPGWWDALVGPGKAIDTNRFFVVCSNNLGGCSGSTGPSSINPKTGQPYGPEFPIVTVRDWVESQARLSETLGIQQWAAVIGGSLGGMQVLQWSITYPERLKHAVVIASAAKLTAQNIGFNDVARQAIRTDPEFHDGNYYQFNTRPTRGLRIARMLGHITYLSDDSMAHKFGRSLRQKAQFDYEFTPEFEVESYLRYQGDQFVNRFDANTYLLMTKALDYFDPAAAHEGQLNVALQPVKANFLVVSFTSDWRFSVERSREIVRALQSNRLAVSYAEVESPHGHDSFLLEIDNYIDVLRAYMTRIANECEADSE
ncbi:homoserine O-succinyltransferase MetX [Arenicella xantha]|uniref:Homoserine O-succinyltransferase n=1 Tax=Arenicella xantha TaxID=644221 RepID=A0A395JHZ0_9GAMM|nr:homoserine O-acetyltransferase [Arenicella xantha]RBP49760.1 homoserine O-acetyltransferase [Arenicella xantha]